MTAVEDWVNGKDPDIFSSGLVALEHRWSKCITLEGNYTGNEEVDLNWKKIGWLLIDSPSYMQSFYAINNLVLGKNINVFTICEYSVFMHIHHFVLENTVSKRLTIYAYDGHIDQT